MRLNIVTGSSNSLGKTFLNALANENDTTIGLSRRGCAIANVHNISVDLQDTAQVRKILFDTLTTVDINKLTSVHLFHTAWKVKNEFNDINNPKFTTLDLNQDWIDDEVFGSTFMTLKNTHNALVECLNSLWKNDLPKFINIIWTLLDKRVSEPSSHKSMVKTNKLIRAYVTWLCTQDPTYKWVCVSVWTIATENEITYRKYWEHQYWLKEQMVVDSILKRNEVFLNEFTDADLFMHNPKYETYYKHETPEQMVVRFKKEIGIS